MSDGIHGDGLTRPGLRGGAAPPGPVAESVAAFAYACDDGSVDDYLAYVAEEVTVEIVTAEGERVAFTSGRDAVREGTVRRRADGALGPGSGRRHALAQSFTTGAEDGSAQVVTGWTLLVRDADGIRVEAAGHYVDTWAARPDRWVLRSRRTVLL